MKEWLWIVIFVLIAATLGCAVLATKKKLDDAKPVKAEAESSSGIPKIEFAVSAGSVPSLCCSSDGRIVYLSTRIAVFKSEDSGVTWRQIIQREE